MTDRHASTQRAVVHRRAGEGPEEFAAASLTLDFDDRQRRRRPRLIAVNGHEVRLDLPRAAAMADRDGLQLEDGRWLIHALRDGGRELIVSPEPRSTSLIARTLVEEL